VTRTGESCPARRPIPNPAVGGRETGENYLEFLKRVAEADGETAPDAAALRRIDRRRKKTISNEDWESPADPEAEITKLKDGRTALAYKVEPAVDRETGAIVAVTTHGGAAADSATAAETLCEAGEAVAELISVKDAARGNIGWRKRESPKS
jgi:transposase